MRCALLIASLACACSPTSSVPTPSDTGPRDGGHESGPPFTPDDCKASLAQKPDVTVGKGQTFYADLTPNETLTWEAGPQGGHHVWIAVRSIGVRKQGTITNVRMEDVENPAAPIALNGLGNKVVYDLDRDEGGHCTLPGLRMQLDQAGAPPLTATLNHHVKIIVTMQDVDGATAQSEQTIVVTGTF